MSDNIFRRRMRWPDLTPRTISFYHEPIRWNGSDRKQILFGLQRAEMQKEGNYHESNLILYQSYHPLTPMYKPNCNIEFASSGLPSKECTTPAVNLSLYFLKIRIKSSLALRQ